ncbi:casein kinase substrate phosphoprotein PP28-domain-containing protein [Aspergillus karnatakaensis]|uniref:PDGFA associated 1 family protein n=1 Tax=Aspergillus karnatakaensis TaxID=1810916 RepID=UPI003CCCD9F0
MAPRGRGGKFGKPSRGGGKHFSRDIQTHDKEGNPVSMWRDPEDAIPSSEEEEEEEEESTEASESESEAGPSTSTPRDTTTSSSTPGQELTREERRALAKAKKATAAARRNAGPAQPGDLPPSDSEEEDEPQPALNGAKQKGKTAAPNNDSADDSDPDLPSNPNLKPKKSEEEGGEAQLSRREREAIEAQQAKERYMKLHAEGKTDEARADLARLALVKERREAERLRKEAEKEEKAELARQRAEEREKKLAKGGVGKKKGKK